MDFVSITYQNELNFTDKLDIYDQVLIINNSKEYFGFIKTKHGTNLTVLILHLQNSYLVPKKEVTLDQDQVLAMGKFMYPEFSKDDNLLGWKQIISRNLLKQFEKNLQFNDDNEIYSLDYQTLKFRSFNQKELELDLGQDSRKISFRLT